MKEFADNIKNAFNVLPDFFLISLFLSGIAYLLYDAHEGFRFFYILMGAWAIIFIGLPAIGLFLEAINRIFGLEPADASNSNKE